MKRVLIAAAVAGLAVGVPYLVESWNILGSMPSAVGACMCAPLLPGLYTVLLVFDFAGVDFFDSSGDLDATGAVLIAGVSFTTWFIIALLAADISGGVRSFAPLARRSGRP